MSQKKEPQTLEEYWQDFVSDVLKMTQEELIEETEDAAPLQSIFYAGAVSGFSMAIHALYKAGELSSDVVAALEPVRTQIESQTRALYRKPH